MTKGKVERDIFGNISKIGGEKVERGIFGNISKVGGERVERDIFGKVTRIGRDTQPSDRDSWVSTSGQSYTSNRSSPGHILIIILLIVASAVYYMHTTNRLPLQDLLSDLSNASSVKSIKSFEIGNIVRVPDNVVEVNMRQSPGFQNKSDDDVITTVPAGEIIQVVGTSESVDGLEWWKVSWNNYEGWIAERSSRGKILLELTK